MSKFKLNIDEPCSQKWEDFTPAGKNGFCSQCQKVVVDFTKFSDQEIREYFKDLPKNVCGQFRDSQLRVYSDPRANKSLSRWLAWPIAATATLFAGNVLTAQDGDRIEAIDNIRRIESVGKKSSLGKIVSGRVTDEKGEGLPGVHVVVKGATTGVTTDFNGNYKLLLSNPEQDTILFTFVGLYSREFIVGNRKIIDVDLIADPIALNEQIILGGACFIRPTRWYTPRG
ncbi:MAG: carboxypeptidase-like regulatory domain-containing protein, partial [Cyclobacteriaceae bacterium]